MAQMAAPAVAKGEDDLGAVQPPLRQLPAAATSDRPCHLSRVAKLCLEEPDAGNPHVRIRGGPGRATGRAYPIAVTCAVDTARYTSTTAVRRNRTRMLA